MVAAGPREDGLALQSLFMGGFECSTHRRLDRQRLDIIDATRHDLFAYHDYSLLRDIGIRVIRDGLRWHLIDKGSHYDWSSFAPMLQAGSAAGVQLIWDFFHYGWPDDLDIWSPAFVDRFARFAGAAARFIKENGDQPLLIAPVNEISFLAWAGADAGHLNPFDTGRGSALKKQLVRASIAATEAIWDVDPAARIFQIDPMINPMPNVTDRSTVKIARERWMGQFEAWDMLRGALNPELGGHAKYLDIVGINFYPHNEWIEHWGPLHWTSEAHLPLRHLIIENYRRYGRPMIIAETGIEGEPRPQWLRYVCNEVAIARAMGLPLNGICLYPIMNHPGWLDERHCPNGLIDYSRETFERSIYEPLAREIEAQRRMLEDPQAQQKAVLSLEGDLLWNVTATASTG